MWWWLLGFVGLCLLIFIIGIVTATFSPKQESRQRIRCVTCKYCRNETLFSGRYPNGHPNRHPTYCRLQRKWLHGDEKLVCSLKNPPEELYADTNGDYYPENFDSVYYSAYGDTYHSTLQCPAAKKSIHMYKFHIPPDDRRPCSKCWVIKDGYLVPKN